MKNPLVWLSSVCALLSQAATAIPFDAAPFGTPLPEGGGVVWEDPREIHRVVVHFAGPAPDLRQVQIEYWGSRWPEQHLPKERQPGGGDVGWMELGNWYTGGWRVADAQAQADDSSISFVFNPVNAKEFPQLRDYPVPFRYTLKLRVTSAKALPAISRFEAFTDSEWSNRAVRLVWEQPAGQSQTVEVFNGRLESLTKESARAQRLFLKAVVNSDPNTFDRTLVSIHNRGATFTFALDDLAAGPLFLPQFGAGILAEQDARDYAALQAEQRRKHSATLYERIAQLPEQTWPNAWSNMPPKKRSIHFPLGLEGGRERFMLQADGAVQFRWNDHFLQDRPGAETPRLALEPPVGRLHFGPPIEPTRRSLEEDCLPICHTVWETNGIQESQVAFVAPLDGASPGAPMPAADAYTVFCARFTFRNISSVPQTARLPLTYISAEKPAPLRVASDGLLWLGENVRGLVVADKGATVDREKLIWSWNLAPGEMGTALVKLPYVVLTKPEERAALERLDFERERAATAEYWRRRLDVSARLITPEPVLNSFYRAHAEHLLVNCEHEPGNERRFARVGSFNYGVFGNESCMMVVDLDRRGYHQEAQECLDAWLKYQGTVALPGDFDSQSGVLYGAGGYEMGGYNQHHGWIMWCLAEHYRFTRDEAWLRRSAPGLVAAADWVIRQTARTAGHSPLERGLLPAGSLEDIGDWWTWLSTSCYTWRGLDAAAWALAQIKHPDAKRIQDAADHFHVHLLENFRAASQRAPVVRLRDGTAVPHFPSYVQRRGRSFGWICETLEGAMHLLITGALDAHSPEAGWILKDYEDNLYLSNQYGYRLDDFDKWWFGRGGMSMQACLLLEVEPFLYRDDVKHALRALFNSLAVSHFPDVHMNTEHALPEMGDWRGDIFKSSDEANACGWLRQLFVREQGDALLLGQAVPREWLEAGHQCGMERAATYFGPVSVLYKGGQNEITAKVEGPRRNPPKEIRLRFRTPTERPFRYVTVNGRRWKNWSGDWVLLPGDIGTASVVVRY